MLNTYERRITYRHIPMRRDRDPYSVPVLSGRTLAALPAGYANHSPRTMIGGVK